MKTNENNSKGRKANHTVHHDDYSIVVRTMRFIIANILVASLFMVSCMSVHMMTNTIGVHAAEASITKPVQPSAVTARGLALDGASISDSAACTLSSATTYPAPSVGYVTYPVSEINGTVIVVVPTSTPSVEASCMPAQTVTVTVTASGTTMASYDAMSVGGAPPQASESTVSTTSSLDSTTSSEPTPTVEATSSKATMTSTEYITLTIGTVTTYYVTVNETTTSTSSDDEPVTVPYNPTGIDTAGTTWTYYTGTWVIVTPTNNGTYTKPTHTPASSVISSGGSGKGAGRDERDRAVKSAFYCIVMSAVMGGWFGILA